MLCPNCGSDNPPEAPACGLCQRVMTAEKPAAPPPAPAPAPAPAADHGPDGPAKLDSGGAIAELLVCALKSSQDFRFDEAERLMSRLYLEVDPQTCSELLAACGTEWLKIASVADNERASAQALLVVVASAVAREELAAAVEMSRALLAAVKEPSAEGLRLQLLLLGIRGAVARGGGKAPPPPPKAPSRPLEPKVLDSVDAWRDLILLAQFCALAGEAAEASRLMTRLFAEAALNDCERLIATAGEQWLEIQELPADAATDLRESLALVGRAVAGGDFVSAHALFRNITAKIKPEPGPGIRLALMALGVKGASARKRGS